MIFRIQFKTKTRDLISVNGILSDCQSVCMILCSRIILDRKLNKIQTPNLQDIQVCSKFL